MLKSGLVAVETHLGWTLMGKVPEEETPKESSVLVMTVTSMFVNELDISNLCWLKEGTIEEVPLTEIYGYGNYLPHQPVLKPSSVTTPILPVFHMLARLPNHPSLNQCLECASNLIELLPDLLLRFREGEFGVIGDIRRASCQISICEEDKDFLRFLCVENKEELKRFIQESTTLMSRGKFELREWEYSGQC
ncbi:DUF1758 domain-containing protein [Trichonephila clavipes]|nr:DUF1758 domain-containing protein [Trichonephila clavipes]